MHEEYVVKYPSSSLLWKKHLSPADGVNQVVDTCGSACSSPLPSYSRAHLVFNLGNRPPHWRYMSWAVSLRPTQPSLGVWTNLAPSLLELEYRSENGWHRFLLVGTLWGIPEMLRSLPFWTVFFRILFHSVSQLSADESFCVFSGL